MARKPRFSVPECPHHVVHRGNNRSSIFLRENDYRTYLGLLVMASDRYGCTVHAYVLMTNHVHLLLSSRIENGVSLAMQWTGARYGEYVNRRYRRTGPLWDGRFKSSLVDSDAYLLACYRYIELNPVRAKMVASPAEYRWSSYRFNALGIEDEVLYPHPSYLSLSSRAGQTESAYRRWCEKRGDRGDEEAIRKATEAGLVFGSEKFKDWVEEKTQRKARRGHQGRPRKRKRGSDPI